MLAENNFHLCLDKCHVQFIQYLKPICDKGLFEFKTIFFQQWFVMHVNESFSEDTYLFWLKK